MTRAPARSATGVELPEGIEILPPDAPREKWLTARRGGIGGSDIPVLCGEGYRTDSPYKLWLDKLGFLDEEDTIGGAAQRGVWLEPHLADWFSEKTGMAVHRVGLVQHREQIELRATPDRAAEDGSLIEIKTFSSMARDGDGERLRQSWRRGEPPRRVWLQGQWQLAATGLSEIWFVGYELDQEPILRGPYGRDEDLITEMRERAAKWWDAHIRGAEPPPVDLATLNEDEVNLRWPTVQIKGAVECDQPYRLKELLRERAELAKTTSAGSKAEKLRKEHDALIRALVRDAEALTIGGQPVMTCREQDGAPRVDPQLEHDHPEIWAEYVTRPRFRVVRPVKGWEAAMPADDVPTDETPEELA